MSDDNFLERWSRLKREAAQQRRLEPPDETANDRATDKPAHANAPPAAKTGEAEVSFDPASLPPIESINALSDIRAFLAPGVPAALTHAALRRAWVADPAIRDFVGLSENAWDFTTPGSIPGFEGIGGSEELRRLVAHFSEGPAPVSSEEPAGPVAQPREVAETSQIEPERIASDPTAEERPEPSTDPDTALLQDNKDDAALRYQDVEVEPTEPRKRRGHGRALPQ
jgi:Protein of unknown function (DUF3306)